MHSPPLTPMRDHFVSSSPAASPTHSYREQFRRRTSTSSLSSSHDRSPVTPRSKHRFSITSSHSGELPTPVDEFGDGGMGGGMGNLADELDQLDDEEDEEEEEHEEGEEYHSHVTDATKDFVEGETAEAQEAARDSGIDVSFAEKSNAHGHDRKARAGRERRPDEARQDEDEFSPELDEAVDAIARLAKITIVGDDPLVPRLVALLQDLGNQAGVEAGAQRLTTSANSMCTHLVKETRALQMLGASLLSPFGFSAALDPDAIDDSLPLIEALLQDLPVPDSAVLQGVQRLARDTDTAVQTLASLTDTLQMGKQITNAAGRHLRTTQAMVAELRRERERAELARFELARSDVEGKIGERWSARQCADVVAGFDEVCEGFRRSLAEAVEATG